ncbi:MAG: NifU N-terminal domain-containing protein, partial [Magnetospirillum sp.]|nr:NifU N-terminal domain-containing protein [Magnetospirillum sp.]
MFIQTEPTPNPSTLKFLPGRDVMGRGTADFLTAEGATSSPLAVRLFAVEGVSSVFLGGDFITVGKAGEIDWAVLKPQILAAIMEHYTSGDPVMVESAASAQGGDADSDIV